MQKVSPVNDPTPHQEQIPLRIFVYGTLMQGYRNHDRLCRSHCGCEPAEVVGRLNLHPAGFPVMQVPKPLIFAGATSHPLQDLDTQRQRALRLHRQPIDLRDHQSFGQVRGQMVSFDDPLDRLRRLDQLEGFHPNRPSEYLRVLVPVTRRNGMLTVAWTYIAGPLIGSTRPLRADRWRGEHHIAADRPVDEEPDR
jgi:gamma-glutamylcyclotransferase (GGCT)/AIG2-like uncharacterized protein YtfP